MAFVGLKVDEGTKELWVRAADGLGLSLSAWLKRAALRELGESGATTQQALPVVEGLGVGEEATVGTPVAPADDTRMVTGDTEPQAPAPSKADAVAEARRLLGGAPKEFRPDFKKGKTK